jgi:hypothetical protein
MRGDRFTVRGAATSFFGLGRGVRRGRGPGEESTSITQSKINIRTAQVEIVTFKQFGETNQHFSHKANGARPREEGDAVGNRKRSHSQTQSSIGTSINNRRQSIERIRIRGIELPRNNLIPHGVRRYNGLGHSNSRRDRG